jgi:hypothetical protein
MRQKEAAVELEEHSKGKLILVPTRQQEPYFLKFFSGHPQFSVLSPRASNSFFLDGKPLILNFRESKYLEKYNQIVAELLELTPIYSRHSDSMITMDLDIRLIAKLIIGLADFLNEEGVVGVNFSFESSHHIYTQVIEKACQVAGIIQVFEYPVNYSPWFITLLQKQSIYERSRVKLLSDDLAVPPKEYDRWLQNTFFRKFERDTSFKARVFEFFSALKKSYIFAALYLFFGDPRARLYTSRKRTFSWVLQIFRSSWRTEKIFADRSLWKTHFTLLRLKRALDYYGIRSTENIDNLRDAWEKIKQKGEIPLVFYAHFQPEATTFPECSPYANIIDTIVSIRNSGYKHPIFYKEHPHMRIFYFEKRVSTGGVARSVEFYQSLEELDCFFVPFELDLGEQRDFMVLTGNGTIAIERSILGLQTLVMAWTWYDGIPGLLTLEHFKKHQKIESCTISPDSYPSGKDALESIVKGHAHSLLDYWFDPKADASLYMKYLILLRTHIMDLP